MEIDKLPADSCSDDHQTTAPPQSPEFKTSSTTDSMSSAMQPVQIDLHSLKPPKRRNVKMSSKDLLSVAARLRRERVCEKLRILQRLVPGGMKMVDAVSVLDETANYMKFLKEKVQSFEREFES
ncbi:hypothetical protein R6Q59_033213 [Mikania micrantha]